MEQQRVQRRALRPAGAHRGEGHGRGRPAGGGGRLRLGGLRRHRGQHRHGAGTGRRPDGYPGGGTLPLCPGRPGGWRGLRPRHRRWGAVPVLRGL